MILDDRKARKLADNLNLRFTGLLGILIKAKQNGVINSVGDVLVRLKAAGFRFSPSMAAQALRLAGEQ